MDTAEGTNSQGREGKWGIGHGTSFGSGYFFMISVLDDVIGPKPMVFWGSLKR